MWIDCHCHTKHSYDNWLEPLDLIRRAKAIGLDGVVITEHHSYEASAPVEAIGRDEGLLVLRGVEISTDQGHLLAYGIEDDSWNTWGRDTWLPLDGVIERILGLGGICVPAHPYREFGVCSLLDGLLDLQGIAAVETHNGGNIDSDNDLAVTATRHMALRGLAALIEHAEASPQPFKPLYDWNAPVVDKIRTICQRIYGANDVELTATAKRDLEDVERLGYAGLPICMAKTQNSLSDNPNLRGRPTNFDVTVRNIQINAGAGFLVVLTGEIMRMPGLPKHPASENIDVVDGRIVGLR